MLGLKFNKYISDFHPLEIMGSIGKTSGWLFDEDYLDGKGLIKGSKFTLALIFHDIFKSNKSSVRNAIW